MDLFKKNLTFSSEIYKPFIGVKPGKPFRIVTHHVSAATSDLSVGTFVRHTLSSPDEMLSQPRLSGRHLPPRMKHVSSIICPAKGMFHRMRRLSRHVCLAYAILTGCLVYSVGDVSSCEVLWETFGTATTPSIGDLIKNVSYKDGYIKFDTPSAFREGNAVIAAMDASGLTSGLGISGSRTSHKARHTTTELEHSDWRFESLVPRPARDSNQARSASKFISDSEAYVHTNQKPKERHQYLSLGVFSS